MDTKYRITWDAKKLEVWKELEYNRKNAETFYKENKGVKGSFNRSIFENNS